MIASRIKALCEERGVSVAEVERAAGIGNGVIRRWDKLNPRLDRIKPVADYLGVKVDDLLAEDAGIRDRPGT